MSENLGELMPSGMDVMRAGGVGSSETDITNLMKDFSKGLFNQAINRNAFGTTLIGVEEMKAFSGANIEESLGVANTLQKIAGKLIKNDPNLTLKEIFNYAFNAGKDALIKELKEKEVVGKLEFGDLINIINNASSDEYKNALYKLANMGVDAFNLLSQDNITSESVEIPSDQQFDEKYNVDSNDDYKELVKKALINAGISSEDASAAVNNGDTNKDGFLEESETEALLDKLSQENSLLSRAFNNVAFRTRIIPRQKYASIFDTPMSILMDSMNQVQDVEASNAFNNLTANQFNTAFE